jgi:hypothetical protein
MALLFHSAGLGFGFLGSRQRRRQTQTDAEDKDASNQRCNVSHFSISSTVFALL